MFWQNISKKILPQDAEQSVHIKIGFHHKPCQYAHMGGSRWTVQLQGEYWQQEDAEQSVHF